jgi:hypothetical protein
MTRRAKRALPLLLYPPYVGLTTAAMAPLFGNSPALMLPIGGLLGWLAAATYLLISEAKR